MELAYRKNWFKKHFDILDVSEGKSSFNEDKGSEIIKNNCIVWLGLLNVQYNIMVY